MTVGVPHLEAAAPTSTLMEVLAEHGAVIVEGVLDEGQVGAIERDLRPHLDAAPLDAELVNAGAEMFFSGVRHVTGLTARSPAFVESLLLNPMLLALAEVWFGSVCSSYQLNIAHLLVRDPGSEAQMVHKDEDVWVHLQQLIAGTNPHPEIQLASITALCDFTPEVGATLVVPGSHRWERGRRPDPQEIVPAVMPKGSSLIYGGSTMHAGGANSSDRPRAAIHHSYVVGWLRTEESGVLAALPDVARGLPRRAQELVGYGCHDAIDQLGGYLGVVDLRNPVDLLADGDL